MLFSTSSMEEESAQSSKEEGKMEEDSDTGTTSKSEDPSWKESDEEVLHLMAKMKKATTLLQLDSEEEASNGSDFKDDDFSIRSNDLDLKLSDYKSDAQEVSSGEFDANYVKKYATPETFLHELWNMAGPSAGAMRICLEIIKEDLAGQIAGIPAEFRDLPEQPITFMYKEAGEDPHDAITFISQIQEEISKYDDDEEEKDSECHIKAIHYGEIEPAPDISTTGDGRTQEASKTQGSLPRAQQMSPTEGTVIEPAKVAGQSVSMAEGG